MTETRRARISEGPIRCAIDTGGTFTDLAVLSGDGNVRLYKHPTTPNDPVEGILGVLKLVADTDDIQLADFLSRVEILVHGTTHSTNAVLTGKTAKTALLVTKGHPDTLLFREGGRPDPFNWSYDYPDPYVPRSLTFEVSERTSAEGDIIHHLDEAALREILAQIRARRVEAIAVCLLWSIVNPMHELRIGELIAEELPDIPFTLSHELNPVLREYRRASSTAIDASLKPVMTQYLAELATRLSDSGFAGRLLMISTAGGLMEPLDMARAPIHSINSGPAGAPVAGRFFASRDVACETVIVADTGGTSYDVTLVRRGEIPMTRETWLGPRFIGHITGFPAIDVHSIGAGGGSIAWVDPGGMLHVGPDSAGADPGPAAYSRGGSRATVTDAALVLGYLDPDYFLGGDMKLDIRAAREAIDRDVAVPLALSAHEAASAVLTVATERMVQAISAITVGQGVDPREAVLIGGGGAAGLNAVSIARRLGCKSVLIPESGAALSSAGALMLGLTAEFSAALFVTADRFDFASTRRVLEKLTTKGDEFLARVNTHDALVSLEFTAEARYSHQVWEIDVPLNGNRLATEADVVRFAEQFRSRHEEIYAVRDEQSPVHILGLRARVTCDLQKGETEAWRTDLGEPKALSNGTRQMFFSGHAAVEAPALALNQLNEGALVQGPAVIESRFTTVVLDPGASAFRLASGSLVIEP